MTRADAEILTVDDLAELFGCDKETAAARLTRGDLPGVKVGRGWIIPRQALLERINQKAHEEAAARRQCFELVHTTEATRGRDISGLLPLPDSSVTVSPPVALKGGRKRRIPPTLPSLRPEAIQGLPPHTPSKGHCP